MKTLVIDFLIIIVFLVAICTVGRGDPSPKRDSCYATCYQFESALLVGCYLSDFEGRGEPDRTKRSANFLQHEKYCRKLVKELMGADNGCTEALKKHLVDFRKKVDRL
jgi:hypothetical protein